MKIVIEGAGEVGSHLANMLKSEANDVTVIDDNQQRIDALRAYTDVETVVGNPSSISVLREANVGDAEFKAVLGREIPPSKYEFYKKNRMVIDENCTVADLRYSRRWVGRLFGHAIIFARDFMWAIGQKTMANTLTMGMVHQPVRGLAKFGGMSRRQMEALLMMFNGHLFKGIGMFFSKEK